MKQYNHTGILKHNVLGRYEFQDGYYFTSGDEIELFIDDMWISGKIEYSWKYQDYYFLKENEEIYIYDINGLKARI